MKILTIDPGYLHLACGLYDVDRDKKTIELVDFVSIKVTPKDVIDPKDKANRLRNLYAKIVDSRLRELAGRANVCIIETPYEQNSILLNQIAGALYAYLDLHVSTKFVLVTWTNGVKKEKRIEFLQKKYPHIKAPAEMIAAKHLTDFWDTVGMAASVGLGFNYRTETYG